MEEIKNENMKSDCGCEGDCCPPKKKSPIKTIIFGIILLAALAILGFKLAHKNDPEAAAQKTCTPGSSCCDTAKTAKCDTTKGSSCCPK